MARLVKNWIGFFCFLPHTKINLFIPIAFGFLFKWTYESYYVQQLKDI